MTAKEQSVSGMPGRYATALFELAQQEEAVEDVGEALLRFANLVEATPDLKRLVRNPVFTAADQRSSPSPWMVGATNRLRR